MDKQAILTRIKELMRERNWNINELTLRTNLSTGTIYEWYSKNERNPTLEAISEICKAFEITEAAFFTLRDKDGISPEQVELTDATQRLSNEQLRILIATAKQFDRLSQYENSERSNAQAATNISQRSEMKHPKASE